MTRMMNDGTEENRNKKQGVCDSQITRKESNRAQKYVICAENCGHSLKRHGTAPPRKQL